MRYNKSNRANYMNTPSEKRMMYNYWKMYYYNPLGDVEGAYKNPSTFKLEAYEREILRARNIYLAVMNPQVITRNTFVFTMGYEFTDKETGELCFMYITPSYRRYCTLGDLEEVSKMQ